MNWPIFIPIFVAVVVVILLSIWWEVKRQRERAAAFQKAADDLGFEFFPHGRDDLRFDVGKFYLFQHGHTKTVRNLLMGQALGMAVTIFDYEYVTGAGKHRQRWRQTVVYLQSADLHLPDFTLRPEHFWHKVATLFGFQDIDFADHPHFSTRYVLQGSSEAAVRTAFTEPVLEYFAEHPGLNVEGRDERFIVYRQARSQSPDDIRSLMETGFEVLAVFRSPPAQPST